jgi:hypothetical protein
MTERDDQPPPIDAHDSVWKDALGRQFPDFLACCLPLALAEVDWTCGSRFLDNELAQLVDLFEVPPESTPGSALNRTRTQEQPMSLTPTRSQHAMSNQHRIL